MFSGSGCSNDVRDGIRELLNLELNARVWARDTVEVSIRLFLEIFLRCSRNHGQVDRKEKDRGRASLMLCMMMLIELVDESWELMAVGPLRNGVALQEESRFGGPVWFRTMETS